MTQKPKITTKNNSLSNIINGTEQKSTTPHYQYLEKVLLVDGKSQFKQGELTNICDLDVSNNFEVELLVYSAESGSLYWIKRDYTAGSMYRDIQVG